jgi:hypothetical protein
LISRDTRKLLWCKAKGENLGMKVSAGSGGEWPTRRFSQPGRKIAFLLTARLVRHSGASSSGHLLALRRRLIGNTRVSTHFVSLLSDNGMPIEQSSASLIAVARSILLIIWRLLADAEHASTISAACTTPAASTPPAGSVNHISQPA